MIFKNILFFVREIGIDKKKCNIGLASKEESAHALRTWMQARIKRPETHTRTNIRLRTRIPMCVRAHGLDDAYT